MTALTLPAIAFAHPWWLAALVLALWPLWGRRQDEQIFASTDWLPPDRLGMWRGRLEKALAVVAIGALVLGLSGIATPETTIERVGSGAEIMVLLDRSASMDDALPARGSTSPLVDKYAEPKKRKIARKALAAFAAGRTHDVFSMMMFSENQFQVMPFNMQPDVIQAAIEAGGVGSGLGNTDLGSGLLAAASRFDLRPDSGSRIILLVSDGGAEIAPAVRLQIAAALQRNRITLYWIYLRSFNQPGLAQGNNPEYADNIEIRMHRFFSTLKTPYTAFEAEDQASMQQAIDAVGRQQMLPITYQLRVPSIERAAACYVLAALACLVLLLMRSQNLLPDPRP